MFSTYIFGFTKENKCFCRFPGRQASLAYTGALRPKIYKPYLSKVIRSYYYNILDLAQYNFLKFPLGFAVYTRPSGEF